MKAKVDPTICTGCGLCLDLCPEVFKMDGEVAKARHGTVPEEAEDGCREAADCCPVEAILVTK